MHVAQCSAPTAVRNAISESVVRTSVSSSGSPHASSSHCALHGSPKSQPALPSSHSSVPSMVPSPHTGGRVVVVVVVLVVVEFVVVVVVSPATHWPVTLLQKLPPAQFFVPRQRPNVHASSLVQPSPSSHALSSSNATHPDVSRHTSFVQNLPSLH